MNSVSETDFSRRRFFQSSVMAIAGALLSDLSNSSKLLAQVCSDVIPGEALAPATYVQQPGLLAIRADALLRQIANGYGFFGQPRNWTTLWSLTQMQTAIQSILQNEITIAKKIASLSCNLDSLLKQLSTYDSAIAAVQTLQAKLQTDISNDNDKAKALLKVITDLADDINAQRTVVASAQAQFDNAVLTAASGGCGIGTVLGVVAAVVAVVGAVATAGTSLVAAYGAISSFATTGITAAAGATAFQTLKAAYDDVKPIVSKVETAINDVNDVKAKYDKLVSTLNTDSDSARVLVEQNAFDTMSSDRLANFDKTVNGAQGVSQDIKDRFIMATHKYFDLAQLRNKKILRA